MLEHVTKLRVRYGETDQMGVVYYGIYALYYEVGRTEWLRQFGITYKDMEQKGVMLPVTELRSRYFRPIGYDEEITLKTYLASKPNKRITFHTDIYNENGKIIGKGAVTLAFVDMKTKQTIAPPSFLMEKIEAALE